MKEDKVKLNVRVHPGAAKNTVTGYDGGILNVKITARPEKGKANEALAKYLAGILGIAKSRIEILKGTSSRSKLVAIHGMDIGNINDIFTNSLDKTGALKDKRDK